MALSQAAACSLLSGNGKSMHGGGVSLFHFISTTPLACRATYKVRTVKATPLSIRCEQGTKGGSGLDVWLGRFAMIGFGTVLSVEIATGKGVLENVGLAAPLPTVALGVTGLVGVLTAVFIFQSASKES